MTGLRHREINKKMTIHSYAHDQMFDDSMDIDEEFVASDAPPKCDNMEMMAAILEHNLSKCPINYQIFSKDGLLV